MSATEIITAQGAESICANRDQALALARAGLEKLAEAERFFALAVCGGQPEGSKHYYHGGLPAWDRHDLYRLSDGNIDDAIEKYRQALDSNAWRFLRNATGLNNLMDATAIEEFEKQLADDPPHLTIESVKETFFQARVNAEDTFNRGVVRAFNLIRTRSSKYKTNDPYKIGPKAIVECALSQWGGINYGLVRDMIDDIERIFFVLDGKKPPDTRGGTASSKIDQYSRSNGKAGTTELDYFNVRLFKNGNIHIMFTNDELRGKVNGIIAKYHDRGLADDRNRPVHPPKR